MRLISSDDLDLAVQAVAAGEIVVLPTRRWYMICANALDHEACARIFSGKSRPLTKSLALVLPHIEAADDLFVTTPQSRQLASAFWPGDLAMILRWRDSDVGQMHASVGTPNALVTMDPALLGELARRSSVPVAATTANVSDAARTDAAGPAITTAEVERFVAETGTEVTYCVDGGICPLANHLTIVDGTGPDARIVRSGVVHDRAVHAAIAVIEPQPSRG
jgi:L-threonylcarbamoyladenylate synthase